MIEFIPELHIYLVDGVIVQNVTTILKYKFKDKYKGIPEKTLKIAAEFGTRVHNHTDKVDFMSKEEIEKYIQGLPIYEKLCTEQHLKLKKKYNIETIENEKIVYNKELGYIGTLDTKAYVKGIKSIIDKKCTSELDKEYVAWQNSLYYYADNDKEVEKSFIEWLPKKKLGELRELKLIPLEDIKNLVKEFKEREIE